MPKLPQGEGVREFYSVIRKIEEYYNEKGYKKVTYLFKKLKEECGFKMSIKTFRYHFNKHLDNGFFLVDQRLNKKKDTPKEEDIIKDSGQENIEGTNSDEYKNLIQMGENIRKITKKGK